MKKKQHIDGLSSREYVRMLIAGLTGLKYEEQEAMPRVKEVLDSVGEERSFHLELGFLVFYSLEPGKIGIICSSHGDFAMRDPSQLFYMTADYREHMLLRVVRTVIRRETRGGSRIMDLIVLDQVPPAVSTTVEKAITGGYDSLSRQQQKVLLSRSVNDLELCVRGCNCLNNANITTLGQLVTKTKREMLKYRNFGRRSLKEMETELGKLGLHLGMKLVEDKKAPRTKG